MYCITRTERNWRGLTSLLSERSICPAELPRSVTGVVNVSQLDLILSSLVVGFLSLLIAESG